MRIYTLILYIIFSLILGIILNKLEEEKENNFFDYIVLSNIYILILSGVFIRHSDNMFLVVLFQTIGNILYITYIKEISFVNNNAYNIIKYILNVVTSYLLNILFINEVDNVFLNVEQMKLMIWLFILGYLYLNIKGNINIKKIKNKRKLFYQDEEYIVMQYAKFKNKYFNVVSSKYKELNLLVYAIMIYENYNRPKLMRKFDEFKYKLFSKKGKFGIMQINGNKCVDDIESINLSLRKLEKIYSKNTDINKVIKTYYKTNKLEVSSIYKKIVDFDKK